MRNFVMTLARAGVLIGSLAAAPTLYAQAPQDPDTQRMMKMMEKCDKMMGDGMMGNPGSRKPNEREHDGRVPKSPQG